MRTRRTGARCTWFRLRQGHHETICEPTCRRCWKVCHEPTEDGRDYCHECFKAAMNSGDPYIISWAADEEKRDLGSGTVLSDVLGWSGSGVW